jgi:hypothetical protein
MSTDLKLTEVISYLESEFPDFAVTRSDGPQGGAVLRLSSPAQVHIVHVEKEFLESVSTDDIQARLTEYRLASTLRDIGEFPIVVSINGCIFA